MSEASSFQGPDFTSALMLKMCCSSFEPAVRYTSPPVGPVLQRLTQLPAAIQVKLLRKSENRTAAVARKGKGRGGGQE